MKKFLLPNPSHARKTLTIGAMSLVLASGNAASGNVVNGSVVGCRSAFDAIPKIVIPAPAKRPVPNGFDTYLRAAK